MFKKIALIAAATMMLVACESKEETLDLEFVELQEREGYKPRAIYVNHEAREYYSVELSSYEYNHFKDLGINKDVEVTKDDSITNAFQFTDPYKYEDESGNSYTFDYINDYYKGDAE